MKKQSGFTLIELMVVMAIIAILATAGLSGYTGYIKKARDTTRIADIAAINVLVLSQVGSTGLPPKNAKTVYDLARSSNSNIAIVDPQSVQFLSSGHYIGSTAAAFDALKAKKSCYLVKDGATAAYECNYTYRLCDSETGYAIGARFESNSSTGQYVSDSPDNTDDTGTAQTWTNLADENLFEVGSCRKRCTIAGVGATCTTADASTLPTIMENVVETSDRVISTT